MVAVAVGLVLVMLAIGKPAPTTAATAAPSAVEPAAPMKGTGAPGCVVPDPTTAGCITRTTAHALAEIDRAFGGYRKGPKIRSVGCWSEHAWNPASDHPKGRGCDLYPGAAREFASGAALVHGNELSAWLRANADALRVSYVIWQGRIWSRERGDRRYTGGGVYDARDAVGGHYDHLHVSFSQ